MITRTPSVTALTGSEMFTMKDEIFHFQYDESTRRIITLLNFLQKITTLN